MALASNNGAAARTIRKDLSNSAPWPTGTTTSRPTSSRLRAEGLAPKAGGPDARRCRNAAAVQLCGHYASAADKKAKPVRWLIVVMTAIVAVGAASWACSLGDLATRPSVQRLIALCRAQIEHHHGRLAGRIRDAAWRRPDGGWMFPTCWSCCGRPAGLLGLAGWTSTWVWCWPWCRCPSTVNWG